MFTGIITNTTTVAGSNKSANGVTLTFKRPDEWNDLLLGESIATDGVCLTVAAIHTDSYDCFLMSETLAKTSFGKAIPKTVNLERSLSASDRLGGHFVQGHVDSTGTVQDIDRTDGYRVSVRFPADFTDLVVYKGSITINGVSLTVASVDTNVVSVALIPHTLQHTTLGKLKVGDIVNIEFDIISKYVAKMYTASR